MLKSAKMILFKTRNKIEKLLELDTVCLKTIVKKIDFSKEKKYFF